ncbi:MAG TPA: hypothetical protein PKZ07_06295 [Sedimentisphaerales bacterium]|nr:hypothetical protein [Sedimentisphaerales bacterium]
MRLQRIRLRPRSPWRTPWQADTLTGALGTVAARVYGAAFVHERLIEPMLNGTPPFVLSDAFPGALLPLPVAARLAPVPQDQVKSVKRAKWVSREDFLSFAAGDTQHVPWDRCLPEEAVIKEDTRRHNTLARDSDTSLENGGLFSRPDIHLKAGIDHFTLYFRTANEQGTELLLDLLHELALTGFGADTATGRGQFDLLAEPDSVPELDTRRPNANALVCLSTFQPAPTDPTDGFWEVFPKFGKLGPDLGLTDVRKKTLMMFRPGSCFKADPHRPFLGRALPMDLFLPEATAAALRSRNINLIHPAFGLAVAATLNEEYLS